jgi:hypothetical protein
MNEGAFPFAGPDHLRDSSGMDLRDYFAAKAMQALVARGPSFHSSEEVAKEFAAKAYIIADAMLVERQAKQEASL